MRTCLQDGSVEFVIPSDLNEARHLQELIENQLQQCHYEDKEIFGIRLALEEAIVAARATAVFVPMGERPGYWTPSTTGSGFEFTPILKPIERFRDSLVIVSNLDRPPGGTHAVSTSTWAWWS